VTFELLLSFRIVGIPIILIGGFIGFANSFDLAEMMDGFESTFRVSQTNGLRKGSVALRKQNT